MILEIASDKIAENHHGKLFKLTDNNKNKTENRLIAQKIYR